MDRNKLDHIDRMPVRLSWGFRLELLIIPYSLVYSIIVGLIRLRTTKVS